ncbi:tetratricopeptide repeat protein [Candidatus Saccharibacteria bacterium]|nr:tetratricopeptide repeat protein [Candidatus Saccharibacteria bacterium]
MSVKHKKDDTEYIVSSFEGTSKAGKRKPDVAPRLPDIHEPSMQVATSVTIPNPQSSNNHFSHVPSNVLMRKRRAARVLLVFTIVACIIFIAIMWIRYDKEPEDTAPAGSQATTVEVDRLRYSGMQSEAVEVAQKALDDAKTTDSKAYFNMQIGSLYESNKEYAKALEYYREAERLKVDNVDPNSAIARCSEALGDKETAIEYYKKAYNSVDTSVIGNEAKLASFKASIERLGGSL